tara:strand:- start:894 stop:1148 length:255 start_codon:yes stop_codon:yes gene_type:complete
MMNFSTILTAFTLLLLFTLSACKQDCGKNKNCALQPDTGNCKAIIIKYYFDQAEGKCKEFTWGGCGGTVPFETLEECAECSCNN